MFRFDATRSGVSPETAIGASNASTLGVAWDTNLGGSVFSSPAVVFNQTLGERVVYVGYKMGVAALDADTGTVIWRRATGLVLSSPAVANGVVYVGSANHYLYALDAATGKLDAGSRPGEGSRHRRSSRPPTARVTSSISATAGRPAAQPTAATCGPSTRSTRTPRPTAA